MPTVLKYGPYRFFFYSGDTDEPPHVHVEREGHVAKFWVDPVRLTRSGGFGRPELRDIERILSDNERMVLELCMASFPAETAARRRWRSM